MSPTSPITPSDLLQRGAEATSRTAPIRKLYERALRLSRSRACRHFNADDAYSPAHRILTAVHDLAKSDGTSPWPLIGEAAAVALQAEIEDRPAVELEARELALTDAFYALLPEVLRDHSADADVQMAELLFVRAAVRRERESRDVIVRERRRMMVVRM